MAGVGARAWSFVGLVGLAGMVASAAWRGPGADKIDFHREIAPVLKAKCASCHGPQAPAAGLRLDTPDGIRKGGVSGKLLESDKGKTSILVQRLRGYGGKAQMPLGFAPLTEQAIQKIERWIGEGASFGKGPGKHWSYVPPKRPPNPTVKMAEWVRNPIDRFILARMEREGLRPSPQAPMEILARRLFLDLTGLPPTVGELDRFLSDARPGAYERLVDRLLASPHYGEKMARVWLDLARYADTNGYEKDLPRQLWPWRDWVIQAFNRNLPYDQFTIEQLAGDLLPNPTQEQLIATGFHRNSMLNDEGGIDPEEFRVVAVMDRVDATATTWLGTTMACAQCHDHKYDPFSQRDYYRLYAFFNQSQDNGRDKDPVLRVPNAEQKGAIEKRAAELARIRQKIIDRTPTAIAQQPEWEREYRESWSVLNPVEWKAQATLTRLEDLSLLASGADPIQDEYTVIYAIPARRITGLRLDAIPDSRLPEGSSGRNFNGNFVLRKIEAHVLKPDGTEIPVRFDTALADFTQGGHDPMSVLQEGDRPGWAIAGYEPKNRVLHTLQLAGASTAAGPNDRLRVRYIHQSRHANHNLGRFRLSVTSDPELALQRPPVAAVRAVLEKPNRSEAESEIVRTYFLSVSPDLAGFQADAARIQSELNALEGALPATLILRELESPRPNRILLRGEFRTPGDPVQPGVPAALGGYAARSNRLGLARWLCSPKNPLTARVQVNRLWEQCFGRGLISTPEDFGSQGEPPSHPELLDWLAVEFIDRGWDIKAMLRLIVTSSTYRQSSRRTPDRESKDPDNRWLSRSPRFRVEAEGVRDIALRASGRLTPTIGGASVMPPQPPGVWENSFTFYDTKDRWVEETGPNRYRRGLYTYWRRTAPFPMALTFDLKTRDVCTVTRSRTNTPLQALNTLNDPLFVECAGALGKAMAAAADRGRIRDRAPYGTPKDLDRWDNEGLVFGFRSCTSRTPNRKELESLGEHLRLSRLRLAEQSERATQLLQAARLTDKPDRTTENAAWTIVANTLLNLDETLTRG